MSRCQRVNSLESIAVLGRHDVVQNWVDRGRKIVEAASDVVNPLVVLVEAVHLAQVDVQQTLKVERRPAHKKRNDYGS